jgi:hypothetical protein
VIRQFRTLQTEMTPTGERSRIGVKVINHFGDEVQKVFFV